MIRLIDIDKHYIMGESKLHALCKVNLEVRKGEFLAVMGPSGSGKSTLMNIIGLLDYPDSGEYFLGNTEASSLDDNVRSDLRNKTIGFIFQNFNLLPRATALRNVMLPLSYRSIVNTDRISQAEKALGTVGLENRLLHRPTQLSGGERQRVAIARALVGQPSVILADEPTGNLDSQTGADILKLLIDLVESGQTVIMVTHDAQLARHAHRIVNMKDGMLYV